MALCAKISAGQAFDCANPPLAGVKDKLVLVNYEDFESATITKNNTNPELIENIVLASGVTGYMYEGRNSSIEPQASLVKGAYTDSFEHTVMFKVFANSAAVKEQLEKMVNGRVVAVVENNYKGTAGAGSFEIFGSDAGLIVSELTVVKNDQDTQGSYSVTLKSSEKSRESHLPSTLFKTDYTTSKAIFDSLY